jgi:hypothetical protein
VATKTASVWSILWSFQFSLLLPLPSASDAHRTGGFPAHREFDRDFC